MSTMANYHIVDPANQTDNGLTSVNIAMVGNIVTTTLGTSLHGFTNMADNSSFNGTRGYSNDTTTDGPISLNYGFAAMVVVGVLLGAVMIGTIFGNTLVLLSLIKFKNLKTVSNYLIGNLAVSDFFLAAVILPFSAVNEMLGYWVFGETICKLWLSMDVLLSTASIWSLCVIAFDRFTATLYPLWYREKRSNRQAVLYITIVWVISTIICVPPILGWDDPNKLYVYENTTKKYKCFLFETQSYVLYSASGSFFIPFFITLFLYIRIFAVLRARIKKMQAARKQRKKNQLAMQSKHLTNAPINGNKERTNAVEPTKESGIEMGQVPAEQDGSGNTEEYSSRSLFGSDSKSDDESTTSAKEERGGPGYTSNSESETARILKNGFKGSRHNEETLVILNPTHTFSESDKDSDFDRAQSLVSTDDEGHHKRIDKIAMENLKNKNKKTMSKMAAQNTAETQPLDGSKAEAKQSKGFTQVLKSGQFRLQRGDQLRASEKRRFDKREQRATKRMAIIIAFFCLCWAPFFTVYVINSFCGCKIPQPLQAFFFWLGYSNSTMNPILYTVFNVDFRRSFQKLLGCKPARRGRK